MNATQNHGGNLLQAAEAFGLPAESLIDFSSNMNVFLQSTPHESWLSWHVEIERYPDPDAMQIKNRIAQIYGINQKNILPTAGGIEALYLAARLFTGKKVAVIEPAFSDYHRAFAWTDNRIERIVIPSDEWVVPITQLLEKHPVSDVMILGNPNNPTGVLQQRELLVEALKKAHAKNQVWIIDEAFIDFTEEGDRNSLIDELTRFSNLILIRSLTKYRRIPGLRLGFLCSSNQHWMERLRTMQPPWSINNIAQTWAREFLTHEENSKARRSLSDLSRLRDQLTSDLKSIEGFRVYPSSTNFLLIELPEPGPIASEIYRLLGQKGILIRVCDSFFGLPAGKFIRISVRTEMENRMLIKHLHEIYSQMTEEVA